MADSIAELRYDAALHNVQTQGTTLDGLRARAGTLLSFNALATAFLGSRALEGNDGIGWATGLGLATFAVSFVLTLLVLMPIYAWDFSMSGEEVRRALADRGNPAAPKPGDFEVLADLLDKHATSNQDRLNKLMWMMVWAGGTVAVEILAWLVEIA